jgi:predicted acyl esterase
MERQRKTPGLYLPAGLPLGIKANAIYETETATLETGDWLVVFTKDHGAGPSFMSDPGNPVLSAYDSPGAHDYRKLAERSDVLVFDSALMERDLEVTGPIAVKIFVSCDCRDFDLWVRLLDLAPDGTSFNLMSPGSDVQRASYREVKKGRQILRPRKIYELGPALLMTSNVFQQGHRIRVQISGSFFPNFSRNLQSGELENNSARLQKATISIYSDRRHPSRIVLPVNAAASMSSIKRDVKKKAPPRPCVTAAGSWRIRLLKFSRTRCSSKHRNWWNHRPR